MMTHENCCTFEQSRQLRELGFDWPCDYYWRFEESWNNNQGGYIRTRNNWPCRKDSAPTLYQAHKWLIEKYHYFIHVYLHLDDCWRYEIQAVYHYDNYVCEPEPGLWWRSYEEALSAGIDTVLEYLKKTKSK